MNNSCPHCNSLYAVAGEPHCKNESCTWIECQCGVTADKYTNNYFTRKV